MAEPRPNGNPPETPDPTPTEPPARSLREIAEDSWDEVVEGESPDEGDDGSQQPVDDGGRKRDEYGRFAKVEPGEAADEGPPSPDEHLAPQPEAATQPAQAVSSVEAPANWSAQDRQDFQKLPREGQAFLLRRHSEMEGDYQRRVQATGVAAQFTEAVAPVFQDPVVQGSLQQNGLSPVEAIQQWAAMHRRAYHPDPRERVNLLVDIARNVGLDPAAIFATSQPSLPAGLSEADLKDPAIKFFADHIGRQSSEVQQLRNSFQQMVNAQQHEAAQQSLKVHRWGIDTFAEAADERGNKLHPYFDEVMEQIVELYKANPNRDLAEAYETACRMNLAVSEKRAAAERQRAQQQQSNQRAAQAARLNVRGRTSAVTGMANGQGEAKSLRDVIDSTADELGF